MQGLLSAQQVQPITPEMIFPQNPQFSQMALQGGNWRDQFQGYQPPMQQPVPPAIQSHQYGTQAYPMTGYGLSPEFMGLLSQQFPPLNITGPQSDAANQIQQLQGLLERANQMKMQMSSPGGYYPGGYTALGRPIGPSGR